MLTLPDVTITLCRSGLVPGSAKIVHPVFVTPVAVQIVRDGCVARPGLRRSGGGHWLCRIQVQIRHRHCVCFALIHGPPFSIPKNGLGPVLFSTVSQGRTGLCAQLRDFAAEIPAPNMKS